MTEVEAFDTLCELRWPNGPKCPKCDSAEQYRISTRRKLKCASCGHHFSPLSGTVFHASKLAISTIVGILAVDAPTSRADLQSRFGVNYRTAWKLSHLMATERIGLTPG